METIAVYELIIYGHAQLLAVIVVQFLTGVASDNIVKLQKLLWSFKKQTTTKNKQTKLSNCLICREWGIDSDMYFCVFVCASPI